MEWDDFPVILGQGSAHSVSGEPPEDDRPVLLGPNGKPIERKPVQRQRIGFHIPNRPRS